MAIFCYKVLQIMDKIDVRVELEGDIATKFLAIKNRYGLKNNTEVVRQIITSVHDGIFLIDAPTQTQKSPVVASN